MPSCKNSEKPLRIDSARVEEYKPKVVAVADTPIFITCLEADTCPKRDIMPGYVGMLRKRLKVFSFTKPI